MSWFSRLFAKPRTVPSRKASPDRKRETRSRIIQRELLYTVVREALVGMGLLSSQFKFKVLTLEQDGLQFVVMVDLSDQLSHDMTDLGGMEANIAQRALSHHKVRVKAVYWRMTDRDLVKRPEVERKPSKFRTRGVSHHMVDSAGISAPQDPTAVTPSGFPITELPDGSLPNRPLGSTQYGDL
jgi:hypothetical protein